MLAPVYGGIFAFILFVLFAGGVLNGVVFPSIVTPKEAAPKEAAEATPTPTPSPSAAETQTDTKNAAGSTADVLKIQQFLKETGPASGVSYALLIVWSFLAGFAERLVPDTLNRLVQKNTNTQGGNG